MQNVMKPEITKDCTKSKRVNTIYLWKKLSIFCPHIFKLHNPTDTSAVSKINGKTGEVVM